MNFETILKYQEWYFCQCHVQIMLLFVYTATRKVFVIFTYWAWAACVDRSRNADGIKFSKILLSIILFPQLRIHKRGCPVSPPRWLCLSDRWKPKCLSVWSCIRDLVFCPYGKQSETVLLFVFVIYRPPTKFNELHMLHTLRTRNIQRVDFRVSDLAVWTTSRYRSPAMARACILA